MSGGQAKNVKLMQLFADVVGVPVILPESISDAVSRGSAMLARFAAERQQGNTEKDLLWDIMVGFSFVTSYSGAAYHLCRSR